MIEGMFMTTLIELLHTIGDMVLVAYILTRLRRVELFGRANWRQQLILMLIFGLFALYATKTAIPFGDSLISLRIAGPAIGGLVAGPWVGAGAGLMGMLERLAQGGDTAVSGGVITFAAGLFAGLYSRLWQGQTVRQAFTFILIFTIGASITTKLLTPDVSNMGLLLLIIANSLAVTFFIYFLNNVADEQNMRSAKAVMENELEIARTIQLSIVPKTFPPFPQVDHCDLYALLEPAKEVGGDLYDFFFIDEKRLFFAIGDVSGKGVPSALMMAVTRTLLKAKMERDIDLAETISQVNNDLCDGNEMVMFVTAFCGILDIETGILEYCSAGHNPPYILRKDGRVEKVPSTRGVALGVVRDLTYGKATVLLNRGDVIVTYTDGVTEAANMTKDLYNDERLQACLAQTKGFEATQIVEAVFQDVKKFADGAPQSDDITLLVLRYKERLATQPIIGGQ